MLESAKDAGMLDAIDECITKAHLQRPGNLLKFLFDFLSTSRPCKIPNLALNAFAAEFQGRISSWSGLGLVAILSEGTVKRFMPIKFLLGSPIKDNTGKIKGRFSVPEPEMVQWIRTRFGYVAGKGDYFNSMQLRSKGAFAR